MSRLCGVVVGTFEPDPERVSLDFAVDLGALDAHDAGEPFAGIHVRTVRFVFGSVRFVFGLLCEDASHRDDERPDDDEQRYEQAGPFHHGSCLGGQTYINRRPYP